MNSMHNYNNMTNTFETLKDIRKAFVYYLTKYTPEQVNNIPQGYSNNMLWNAGHVISAQQGLTYGLSGLQWTAPKEIVKAYRKGTVPDGINSEERVELVKSELITSIDKLESDYNEGIFTDFQPYNVMLGPELTSIEQAITFLQFHEGLHLGVLMSIRKLVK